MQLQHVVGADGDVLAQTVELVGALHQPVEDLHGQADHVRVRDPGAVVAVGRLALLVGPDPREGGLVGGGVALDRDLGRHTAHGEGAAAVAGLDQLQRIGAQEGLGHGHHGPVGRQELGPAAEPLDEGEDVVPASAVQADDVVLQLIEDLVHLEGGRQGLDQHRRLDGPDRQAERLLGVDDDVVP